MVRDLQKWGEKEKHQAQFLAGRNNTKDVSGSKGELEGWGDQ